MVNTEVEQNLLLAAHHRHSALEKRALAATLRSAGDAAEADRHLIDAAGHDRRAASHEVAARAARTLAAPSERRVHRAGIPDPRALTDPA